MKKALSIVITLILLGSTGFAPKSDYQKVDTNAKIKAVFIYNFTKYIEWPAEDQVGEFKIGILGENPPLFNELDKMSKVKKVSNRSFSIKSFSSLSEIVQPHILYIPVDSTELLKEAVKRLSGKSTLIVTEKPGMALQGSAINFVIVGSRQKFELNKSNVSKHNLKVASTLETLAVMVN